MSLPIRRLAFATVAGASLLAAACGGGEAAVDSAVTGAGQGNDGQAQASDGPVLDASVLSGQAMTIGGESFDLGSLAGKDLVVWFWAPW